MFIDSEDFDKYSRFRKLITVDYISMKSGRSYRKYFENILTALKWCASNESRIFKAVVTINSICECDIIIDDTDHATPAVLG